jgi:hypothetical protein
MACKDECRCRDAICTAYRELTRRGASDARAVETCARLYQCHHRTAGAEEARRSVLRCLASSPVAG